MQAILFADRSGVELSPINKNYSPAMLPLAGKPALEHHIENLKAQGVDEIFLIVGTFARAIQNHFENGARWSLRIRYVLSHKDESPDRVRRRIGGKLQPPFIAARGDIWRNAWLVDLCCDGNFCALSSDLENTALQRVTAEPCSLKALKWPLTSPLHNHASSDDPLQFNPLTSLADYHQIALLSIQAQPPNRLDPDSQQGIGLQTGAQSRIHPVSLESGSALVGDYSRVDIGARLTGQVLIGNHCIIDRGAQLHNSVVLHDSYVGAGLEVKNAIIDKACIIRVDLNTNFIVTDQFLLGSTYQGEGIQFAISLVERLSAATIMLITLPIWPLAVLVAVCLHPQTPVQRRPCYSNKQATDASASLSSVIDTYRFNLPFKLIASLPMLWCVVRGHLKLFGRDATPQPEDSQPHCPESPWHVRYTRLPFGLISPARLRLSTDCDPVTLQLTEIEHGSNNTLASWLGHFGYALKYLLQTRYWFRTRPSLDKAAAKTNG